MQLKRFATIMTRKNNVILVAKLVGLDNSRIVVAN
jgi:hypothetical protein